MKYEIDQLFSSVFLTILQKFSLEVTLIRDQGWINVGAYSHINCTEDNACKHLD